MSIETVKIKSDNHPSGYIIVNKDDAHKYKQPEPKQSKPVSKPVRGK